MSFLGPDGVRLGFSGLGCFRVGVLGVLFGIVGALDWGLTHMAGYSIVLGPCGVRLGLGFPYFTSSRVLGDPISWGEEGCSLCGFTLCSGVPL